MTQLTLNLLKDLEPTGEMTTSSLPVGSLDLANHTAQHGNEKARMMTVTSGRKCLEQFEKLNPSGLWAKTFLELLVGTGAWYSTRCKLTWKLKGTRFNRYYFQLVALTHPIKENEFGLLHTPRAFHAEMEHEMTNAKHKRYRKNDLMNLSMLPTPKAQNKNQPCEHGQGGKDLQTVIHNALLPTPATRDYKGTNDIQKMKEKIQKGERAHQGQLANYIGVQASSNSQLNPLFVGEMMGFPENWTVLPFLNGETKVSKDSVMQ